MDAKLGVLSGFDAEAGTFQENRLLNFAAEVNARSLLRLEDGSGLIITNDNYPQVVDLQ